MGVNKAGARNRWRVTIWHRGRRKDWIVRGVKEDAEAFAARKRIELETSDPASALRVVPGFSGFCAAHYRPHAELRLKASSWYKQSFLLATLMEFFGEAKLTEVRAADVERFARKRLKDGLKPVSVNNELRVLRRVLNFARERGVPACPATFKLLPERGKDRLRAWTAKEIGALLEACTKTSPDILPLIVFLVNTGARKGEALALTWDHIDLDRRMIHIWPSEEWQPKSNRPREVPISDALLPWLSGERRSPKWVFPSRTGDRFVSWPKLKFDRARKAANLTGGPHTLRHTFATHFLAGCPDLYLLAKVLGHSDVAVTNLYAHLLPEHLARARNVVSFAAPSGPATVTALARWGSMP
jgi:integrase